MRPRYTSKNGAGRITPESCALPTDPGGTTSSSGQQASRNRRMYVSGRASMKRVAAFLIVVLGAIAASAQSPVPLTDLHDIAALTNAQASLSVPVSFEATVIYYRGYGRELFVQDGDAAIYVYYPKELHLVAGDRIQVKGVTHESFRPYIVGSELTQVGHVDLPKPLPATYEQMLRGETDCRLVSVHALIRSADIAPGDFPYTMLQVLVDGGLVNVDINDSDASTLNKLLDAEVEITGAASGRFNDKMEQTGIVLHVQKLNGIKILKRPESDPWSLPVTPMDRVITGYRSVDQTQRVHVHGTLTYYLPGSALVLQNGNRSLWISTASYQPLRLGDLMEVTGFPGLHDGFLTLTRAEVKDTLIAKPVVPTVSSWRELAGGGNFSQGHGFDLVTIQGEVVAQVREATQDGYVLSADGHLVSAIYSHPGGMWGQSWGQLAPMKELPVGAKVQVTGICILSNPSPFTDSGEVAFDIYLRNPDDISIVAQPPWLNVRHLIYLVSILLIALLAIGARALYFEHRSRRQTAALAQIEQRRSSILEDINTSQPLAEILEKITTLVEFNLHGAPCWCQLADGAEVGARPNEALGSASQTAEHAIHARNGAAIGKLCTDLAGRDISEARARESLAMAAELATLAVETSRLYSDLVHRSEFDLLTDIHNRFSLEASLDAHILQASQSGTSFGLVYIDLNDFKLVNDRYGHNAGDIYLQQVAARMKRQIRPGDMVARLGGDEFAVMVGEVSSREEIRDIAMRLECCFDEPFDLPSGPIKGSASIGAALYPDDGATRDSILNAADAVMYAAKHEHRKLTEMLSPRAENAAETIR